MQRTLPDFGTYEIEGKFYLFKYKPDLSTNVLDKISPILQNDELAVYAGDTTKPIVYTWIIGLFEEIPQTKRRRYETEKSGPPVVLYAREAKDRLELLSKHMVIDYEVNCNNPVRNEDFANPCINEVLYAGEMKVDYSDETNITGVFNTLSGTYMADKTLGPGEMDTIQSMLTNLTGIPLKFIGNETTMIVDIPNLKVLYDSNAVDIYKFDTKKDVTDLRDLPMQITRLQQSIDQRARLVNKLKIDPDMDTELKQLNESMSAKKMRFDQLSQQKPIIMGGRKTRRRKKSRRKTKRRNE